MTKVPNGEEKLPKISTGWVGCTNVTDRQTDRQTDGTAMAYSTFTKNGRTRRQMNSLNEFRTAVNGGDTWWVILRNVLSARVLMTVYGVTWRTENNWLRPLKTRNKIANGTDSEVLLTQITDKFQFRENFVGLLCWMYVHTPSELKQWMSDVSRTPGPHYSNLVEATSKMI